MPGVMTRTQPTAAAIAAYATLRELVDLEALRIAEAIIARARNGNPRAKFQCTAHGIGMYGGNRLIALRSIGSIFFEIYQSNFLVPTDKQAEELLNLLQECHKGGGYFFETEFRAQCVLLIQACCESAQ